MQIKIKYFDTNMEKIDKIKQGDWIDLRAAADMNLKQGEFALVHLGVAMQLPEGYEAHVAPRSSTCKKWGIIQANSIGIIDQSYCGDNDEWMMPVIAIRDTHITKGDRICQFRIMQKQPAIDFIQVEHLENEDRGGFGSTGTN